MAKASPPPPAPEPEKDLVDLLFDEPLYLAAGGAVLLLGGLGVVAARRRRLAKSVPQADDDRSKIAPTLGHTGAASAALLMATPSSLDEKATSAPPAAAGAPEADNDLDFNPATQGAEAPERSAVGPEHPASAVSGIQVEPPPVAEPPPGSEPSREVEPPPRAPTPARAAEVLQSVQAGAAEPFVPDPVPDTSAPPPAATPAPDTNTLDFDFEPLPAVGTPLDEDNRVSSEPPAMDFKLDLNSLDFEKPEKRSDAAPGRDNHWYDVQQKFDLAKAYEEMGEKDGARDILQEVLKEGDAEQQAQAKKLLGFLS